jgi:hypothetical protein
MLMEKGVNLLSNKLPKVISPKTRAILDYAAIAGPFFVIAGVAWKRHRRAAITSLACGVAETTIAMLTDYPGGVGKVISYPTRAKIDAGIAVAIGSLPNAVGFAEEWPAWVFRGRALGLATIAGLTDYSGVHTARHPRYRAA